MAIIQPQEADAIRDHLERHMRGAVELDFFRGGPEAPEVVGRLCDETEQLLHEVAALSPKLVLRTHRPEAGAAPAASDRVPAVTLSGAARGRVRFIGAPAGFEVGALLEGILDVSCGDTSLFEATRRALGNLTADVHIQVLVTPACRYCHPMARMAHQMAVESERVRADVIEVSEFPELVDRYQVRGVPTVIINDRVALLGLRGEKDIVEALQEALAEQSSSSDQHTHPHDHRVNSRS